jgi:CRISPR-associated protein Cas2
MDSVDVENFTEELLGLINPEHDTVRLYPLDSDNDRNIVIIGTGNPVQKKSYAIV